ncbi:MAG TPA: PucR family transcriptional regulator, partial [Clostridiaceae bacterium]|nr:PucR family transcriptional regulator [Clostridiaceae bacterium]
MEELKQSIEKASEFMDRVTGVANSSGVVLYATDESLVGTVIDDVVSLIETGDGVLVSGSKVYRRLMDPSHSDYVCFVEGTDHVAQTYLELMSRWLMSEMRDGSTEEDQKYFVKNVLLENELPGDIPLKAREHHIPYAATRVVYIIRVPGQHSIAAQNVLEDLFPVRKMDLMLTMDENSIVLLKELQEEPKKAVGAIAEKIAGYLFDEGIEPVNIGIGMTVETLKDCARSYREASLALTIGDIFEPEQELMFYNRLGLGRLIYQLPPTLCRMFLDEVFPNASYDELDDETLLTIDKFFDNNLNGSETSRQLFVHRNTLVYRLDKVQKITDLDLRNFDDAVLFKLASMVRKYL